MRNTFLLICMIAASLICMSGIAAFIYGFLPAGNLTRGLAFGVVALVAGFIAVKCDSARKRTQQSH